MDFGACPGSTIVEPSWPSYLCNSNYLIRMSLQTLRTRLPNTNHRDILKNTEDLLKVIARFKSLRTLQLDFIKLHNGRGSNRDHDEEGVHEFQSIFWITLGIWRDQGRTCIIIQIILTGWPKNDLMSLFLNQYSHPLVSDGKIGITPSPYTLPIGNKTVKEEWPAQRSSGWELSILIHGMNPTWLASDSDDDPCGDVDSEHLKTGSVAWQGAVPSGQPLLFYLPVLSFMRLAGFGSFGWLDSDLYPPRLPTIRCFHGPLGFICGREVHEKITMVPLPGIAECRSP